MKMLIKYITNTNELVKNTDCNTQSRKIVNKISSVTGLVTIATQYKIHRN